MPTSKPLTSVLIPYTAPSNTTQTKTALFRGFLGFELAGLVLAMELLG